MGFNPALGLANFRRLDSVLESDLFWLIFVGRIPFLNPACVDVQTTDFLFVGRIALSNPARVDVQTTDFLFVSGIALSNPARVDLRTTDFLFGCRIPFINPAHFVLINWRSRARSETGTIKCFFCRPDCASPAPERSEWGSIRQIRER